MNSINVGLRYLVFATFATTMCAQDHSIETLVAQADSIVVGSVSVRSEMSNTVVFDINVESTLKGNNVPAVVHINHVVQPAGLAVIGLGDNSAIQAHLAGLWFLSHNNNTWDVLPTDGSNRSVASLFLPGIVSPPQAFQLGTAASAEDLVTLSLFAAVFTNGYKPEFLLDEISQPARKSAQVAFTNYLASTDPAFQCVGIAGLLRSNDAGTIEAVPSLWPKIKSNTCSQLVSTTIRDYLRPSDDASMINLIAIAMAVPDLRSEAINAIAAVHTPKSLGFLAGLLSSTVAAEQMKGVFGLSSFANGCVPQTVNNVASLAYLQIPASAPYQTPETIAAFGFRRGPDSAEATLIQFWQAWWGTHPELH